MTMKCTVMTPFINLYDLGHAHGRGIYKDFADFKKDLLAIVYGNLGNIFVCVTIPEQTQERKWLATIGFRETKITARHWQHVATKEDIVKATSGISLEDLEKQRQEHLAKLQAKRDARPRNAEGRLLRNDGKVVRRPHEYFVGDRVRFSDGFTNKEGTVRAVTANGYATKLKLRTREIYQEDVIEILERAQ